MNKFIVLVLLSCAASPMYISHLDLSKINQQEDVVYCVRNLFKEEPKTHIKSPDTSRAKAFNLIKFVEKLNRSTRKK